MDTVYNKQEYCCGCSLCEYICPKNAIKMVRKNGFLFPEINTDLCIDCKKCQQNCPFLNHRVIGEEQKCFAAKHKNKNVINNSSSGGVFTALSDYVLNEGGVIFSAAFTDDMKLIHKIAKTSTERNAMRGSKYIQSDCTGIYSLLNDELKKNKPVLFCGTPCQISAVRNAFPFKNNLYLMDLICHGVPNPLVWEKFVSFIENKYGQKLSDYKFRDKRSGWRNYSAFAKFQNGQEYNNNDIIGSYIELFRYDVCLRNSCTVCPYSDTKRQGDITVGDFWGIENFLPEIDDNKGVSAVICNTAKGDELLNNAKDSLELFPCKLSNITARQPNMSHPSSFSNKSDSFANDFSTMPFDKVLKKYTRVGIKRRAIDLAKRVLKK